MSKTVDQRVVEMQFDNRHFEKNVSTTMSTLDKLKAKLHLDGATKGLENVNAAASKVNMSGLGAGVEAVRAKFSALEVMGVTALANITNSAVNAGKRIVSSLTIQPIMSGFNEYELKMGSIQTIMASTGESLDKVNEYLNELNEYSDKTIYSFQDMTSNIGKFTNAGVKLEDAVLAMKGISNEAAVSGANANEASRAMYNFAQALSSGYVKLIDWKSIELANMATVEFKEQLIESAVAAGTLKKVGDGLYKTLEGKAVSATKNFNESLQDQWMTSEVLIGTLKKYADETTEIGAKATKAATEVKTYSQMMDALRESAQSGWAQTWEIIFGDFEEGKSLWTSINKVLDGMIGKMTDARNNFLKGALASKWDQLSEKIQKAGLSTEKYQKIIEELVGESELKKLVDQYGSLTKALKKGKVPAEILTKALKKLLGTTDDNAKSLEEYSEIVNKVIRGDFGNGAERVKKLTEAGYNYYKVQNLVNEKLGDSFRYTSDLTEAQLENADALVKLNDEQLKAKGFTDEQIAGLRELKKAADEGGTSINELINSVAKPSGRDLILDTFSNFAKEFSKLLSGVKEAWNNVFGDKDASKAFYGIIEQLHELSESFTITEEQAKAFKTIIEGAFAGLELSWTIFGLSMNAGLKILNSVLNLFGTDILKVASYVADLIIQFNDWAQSNTLIWGYIQNTAKVIHALISGVYECIKAFVDLELVKDTISKIGSIISKVFGGIDLLSAVGNVDKFVDSINKAFEAVKKWIESLNGNEAARNIIDGLLNGLEQGLTAVVGGIVDLGKKLITAFCDLLGIASPSKVFILLGSFIVMGLAIGISDGAQSVVEAVITFAGNIVNVMCDVLKNGIPFVIDVIKTLGSKLLGALKESQIDLSKLFVIGTVIGLFIMLKKITDLLGILVTPIKAIGGIGNAIKDAFKSISGFFNAKTKTLYADIILNIAKAIAILSAALIALSYVNEEGLERALFAITTLGVELLILMGATKYMDPVGFGKLSGLVLSISASILLLSFAIKKLSDIDMGSALLAVGETVVLIGALVGMATVYGKFAKGEVSAWVDQAGIMVLKIALAIGVLAVALKLISGSSWGDIGKAAAVIVGISAIFAALVAVSQFSGEHADKAGSMILKMSVAIGVLAVAMKIIAGIHALDIIKGLAVIAGVSVLFAGLVAVSKFSGQYASKAGWMLLQMSLAMTILAGTIKIIAGIPQSDIEKGLDTIAYVEMLFVAFIAATNRVGPNAGKIGGMLLGMSAGMLLLAFTIKLIASSSASDIAKGIVVIGMLEAMFAALIAVTKANGRWADRIGVMMTKMAIAIGIMAGVIALMSLLDPMDVATGTAAISVLTLCFAALINATKYINKNPPDIKKLAPMLIAVGILAGIVAAMSLIPDPTAALTASAGLSMLLLSLSGAFTIASYAGPMASKSVGALALMALVVGELGIILGLMSHFDVNPSIEVAEALSMLLLSMSASLVLLGFVGTMGPAAFIGIGALATLIAGIGGLIVGIGALMDKFPMLEEFLNKGIPIIEKIGHAIGSFFGNIVGGFLEGAASTLPAIGDYLGEFMDNLQPFISGLSREGMGDIIENAKSLSGAILEFAKADFVSSLSSIFGSDGGLENFAYSLSQFMTRLGPFLSGCSTVTPEVATGAKNLAEAILALTQANLTNVFTSWFSGGSTDGFIASIGAIGTALRDFVNNLGTFDETTVTTVKCAGEALNALADAAESLPGQGGIWQALAGEQSLATFGDQLVWLGQKLRMFVSGLGTFDETTVTTVRCACDALKALADAAASLPGQGGFWQALVGEQSLGAFGEHLGSLGSSLRTFVNNLGEFSEGQVTTVKSAVSAVEALAGLANADLENASLYLDFFGTEIVGFADDLSSFCSKLTTNEGLTAATNNLNSFLTAISSISNANIDALKNLGTNLKNLGSGCVDKFVTAFTSDAASSSVKKAGAKLATNVVDGLESKEDAVKKAGENLAEEAIDGMDDFEDEAESAGKDLGNGLIAGIEAKEDAAYDAGYALGQAAVQGEKDGQQSNSPSKLTILAGKWIGDGLVIGMKNMIGKVYNAGNNLGETATNSISSTISRISDAINNDIDAQPTIRPVLDLSDVRSGVGSINDMMAIGSSIGVAANVNAISSMMARRGQNGVNTEVVSAINKLRKDLGNVGNTSYNINGITYDNGSEVADAVRTIARAIKVEGRA